MTIFKSNINKNNLPAIDISSKNFTGYLLDNGYSIENIFFKCRKSNIYKIYADMFGKPIEDISCGYKHQYIAERAVVVYYGINPLEGEFHQLLKIYNIVPENTAKPIAIAVYENETVGYFLEYINGKPLYTFELEFKRNIIFNTLVPLINNIHAMKVGHGDINIGNTTNNGNIVVTNEGSIKLIDPLPAYDHVDDNFRIDIDRMALFDLIRKFE